MDLGLKGKVTLVSAASAGIGKAVALEMAEEGSDISICARGKEDLEKAAEEVRKHGVRVVAVQADVTKAEDVQRVLTGFDAAGEGFERERRDDGPQALGLVMQIAERLGISPKTVEAHRTSLMRKVGVRKATELVRYALRHGLIQP